MPDKFLQTIPELNLVELESLVDSLPDPCLRFGAGNRLTYANPAAGRAFDLAKLARLEDFIMASKDREVARVDLSGPGGQPAAWFIVRPAKADGKEGELIIANQALRQRQRELEALKSLSDRLINIFDIKEGIRTLNNYLDEVLDFGAAFYFILTPEEEAGFVHSSHRKEAVSERFMSEARAELARRVRESGGPDLFGLGEAEPGRPADLCPAEGDDCPRSYLFFPLKIGGTVLGGLLAASRQTGLYASGGGWLADAMVMTFLLFVVRWQTLGRSQKSRTETLVASLSDGIIMFNSKLRVILANRQASVFTGLAPEAMDLDRLDGALSGMDLKPKITEMLVKASSLAVERYQLNNRHYQIVFTPVKDNQGKVVSGAIIFHDISRLVEIDQMKTDFVYIASHQLRTPLTGIKWFVKLLKKDLEKAGRRPSRRQRECLEQIIVANDMVIKLVNDLLNISRIESNRKFVIERSEIDFQGLVRSILKDLVAQTEAKGIKVVLRTGKGLVFAADPDKIRQVLHNLIDNAVKYTPAKGRVALDARADRGGWRFAVSDTGMGIPKEQQSRVFEKFFRADNATLSDSPGTGLGLHLAKALVEAHGGKLWFKSGEGKGTTFFFTIPRV